MPDSTRGRSEPDRAVRFANITKWPLRERLHEKLHVGSASSLAEEELLAILLGKGRRGHRALDQARRVLASADSLRGVSRMSVADLVALGVGRDQAADLVAAFELGRRVPDRDGGDPVIVRSPEDVVARLGRRLRDLQQEEFWVVLLSSSGRVLREVRISLGTLNSSIVHPRECFHPAVKEPAASVVFVHNHPSGDAEPSREDLAVTRQLVEAGRILGIPVLDHVIIAGKVWTSFAERGLMCVSGSTMP
jgi:DNA repair protein RadC